jgi:hypothetical protein
MVRPHRCTWSFLLSATVVVCALGAWISRSPAAPRADAPQLNVLKKAEVHRLGIDSCNARGCHGAIGATDPLKSKFYVKGGEANTWSTFDPHSRAYAVLLEPRSRRIGELLKADLKGQPPYEAKLCLDCHSVTGTLGKEPAPAQLVAGVDCETCHGAASQWVGPHVRKDWLDLDRTKKKGLGFQPTMDLVDRAKLCVTCHVGDPTRQVNHDLIAAGHPRLVFEFDTFLDALPRHWLEEHEKSGAKATAGDFHANAWAIGQVVAAESSLDLLKARAEAAREDKSPWPEFTEHDCFACHHGLASPAWRQDIANARPPGSLPWGSLTLPGLKALAGRDPKSTLFAAGSPLSLLKKEMETTHPDASKVAELAHRSAAGLLDLRSPPEKLRFDVAAIAALIKVMNDPGRKPASWDEAAASWFAITASARALRDLHGGALDPAIAAEVERAGRLLAFPSCLDSPKGYQP